MSRTIHESLKDAYEDVAYVGRPNPWSHPDRLHDRFRYKRDESGLWSVQRLYP